ncbi:MAG: NAD(P)H-dependent glycerol-3-phosphate dehydrogenase [Clostridia bacterium]|nr:NAD(P)H-dependent glycerol-3-phosphate dehydrogenase [Clostridia bacterium]
MEKISVIGSGSWGCALTALLAGKGYKVKLWSWLSEESEKIAQNRENTDCLPGIKLPETVEYTYNNGDMSGADLYLFAVPSHAVRSTAKSFSGVIEQGKPIVNVAKGFETSNLSRLSEILSAEFPDNPIVVLSGPSHAEEVGKGIPTTVVAASYDEKAAELVQDVFMTQKFRVYTNNDVIGVELGGALKNVIALCTGIADGLGLGDNTKAALMTRGLAEIKRLGIKMGANANTFAGLSGVGDLIVTCTSMHSRNRRAGILIGKGMNAADAQKEVKMVVEGVYATEAAYKLAQKYGVQMPITHAAYEILFENRPAADAVMALMTRDKKGEEI